MNQISLLLGLQLAVGTPQTDITSINQKEIQPRKKEIFQDRKINRGEKFKNDQNHFQRNKVKR
jgi:sialic acid synthase SpsE